MAPGQDSPSTPSKSVKFGEVYHSLPPNPGDLVYTMRGSLLEEWCLASVLEEVDSPRGKKYKVQTIEDDGDESEIKEVTTAQMASSTPPIHKLSIGTRIIARYKDLLESNPDTNNLYYIGIIAETLKPINKYRYLIFFDDGCAQYVDKDDILLVYKQAQDVWTEVDSTARTFTKKYMENMSGRPKVRLNSGDTIPVEYDGSWYTGQVEEVDCLLAKIRYIANGKKMWEWIYRGSARLHPIFRVYEMLENRKRRAAIPDADANFVKKRRIDV